MRTEVPNLAWRSHESPSNKKNPEVVLLGFKLQQTLGRYQIPNRIIVLFKEGFAVRLEIVVPQNLAILVAHLQ